MHDIAQVIPLGRHLYLDKNFDIIKTSGEQQPSKQHFVLTNLTNNKYPVNLNAYRKMPSDCNKLDSMTSIVLI